MENPANETAVHAIITLAGAMLYLIVFLVA